MFTQVFATIDQIGKSTFVDNKITVEIPDEPIVDFFIRNQPFVYTYSNFKCEGSEKTVLTIKKTALNSDENSVSHEFIENVKKTIVWCIHLLPLKWEKQKSSIEQEKIICIRESTDIKEFIDPYQFSSIIKDFHLLHRPVYKDIQGNCTHHHGLQVGVTSSWVDKPFYNISVEGCSGSVDLFFRSIRNETIQRNGQYHLLLCAKNDPQWISDSGLSQDTINMIIQMCIQQMIPNKIQTSKRTIIPC